MQDRVKSRERRCHRTSAELNGSGTSSALLVREPRIYRRLSFLNMILSKPGFSEEQDNSDLAAVTWGSVCRQQIVYQNQDPGQQL